MASIVSDGRHARVAARCGLGAVAGAKGLKAVAVRGSGSPFVADPEGLEHSVKSLLPSYLENAKGMSLTGTAWLVVNQERLGSYPIKNWSLSRWQEGALKTGWEEMSGTIFTRRFHCGGCVIGCGRTVQVKEGAYAGEEQGGPEYETWPCWVPIVCWISCLPCRRSRDVQPLRNGYDRDRRRARLRDGML